MYTKLNNVIAEAIKEYPTLFEGKDYATSRLAVLNHLFLVLGNGLAWTKNGYLAEEGEDGSNGVELVWRENHWWADVAPPYNPDEPVVSLSDYPFRDKAQFEARWRQRKGWSPYPCFRGAAISLVPDNVQPDWLKGAVEVVEAAIDWYANPYNQDQYMKHGPNPDDIRYDNIFWLEDVLEKLQAIEQAVKQRA